MLPGEHIYVQPLRTAGLGWGSREHSRRQLGDVHFECVAYFDYFGNLYFMCLKLLNELQDGGADQRVRRFIELLNMAAPGQTRRGR